FADDTNLLVFGREPEANVRQLEAAWETKTCLQGRKQWADQLELAQPGGGTSPVKPMAAARFLGVWLDWKLNWKAHLLHKDGHTEFFEFAASIPNLPLSAPLAPGQISTRYHALRPDSSSTYSQCSPCSLDVVIGWPYLGALSYRRDAFLPPTASVFPPQRTERNWVTTQCLGRGPPGQDVRIYTVRRGSLTCFFLLILFHLSVMYDG
ncbi:hypothetical protein N657DRAFT_584001, partial [Parathielavia appendiculata]